MSNDDYVYSIIKHHLPETFELVESLAKGRGFAQLLGPIDIVMTAVRLVAAARGLTDFESPDKSNFDSLRKDPSFLTDFLTFVKSNRLSAALQALTDSLRYDPANTNDPGLPMHGFILVRRPVLQVLLYWLLQAREGVEAPEASLLQRATQSRGDMLRFALYARLALPDISKASAWAFDWMKRNPTEAQDSFPGQALVAHLIQRSADERRDVAWPLPSKEDMRKLVHSKPTDPNKPLLGYERFQKDDEDQRIAMGIFQRWWGNSNRYQYPMLLWLQRAYVERIDQNPANVSADDEVPYDYDHICPANHWSDWTGISAKDQDRLIDFLADKNNRGHDHIGNSIGNVRVWFASDNRGDQDSPAAKKLKLGDSADAITVTLLYESAIDRADASIWKSCSEAGSGIAWTKDRASKFQEAVESRVLGLYARYFDELGFDAWFPQQGAVTDGAIDSSTPTPLGDHAESPVA